MRERLASVRVRLVAATVVVLAAALGAGSWMLLRSVEDTQQGRLRDAVEARLDAVATRLEAGDDPETAIRAGGGVGLVQLVDATTGDVLFVAGPAIDPRLEPAVAPYGALVPTAGMGQVATPADPPGADAEGVGGPVVSLDLEPISRTVRTPRFGPITVVAAAPADEVARSVEAVRQALLLGLPLLLATVGVAAWVVVGRALRPVERMRREVEAITASTLHRRVPEPEALDEVGLLARTMNGMLDRLEVAATRQRDFVSDASHELRSPVATIRTELEVGLRAGADGLREAVERALTEEARLEGLLADLLLLASVEGGAGPLEAVPLHELASAEARRSRQVAVTVAQPLPAVAVDGRPVQLTRVVANLLDNAARHARGRVVLGLAVDDGGGEVVLTVDDDGPGIPTAERARVFERFTRLDEGRARDDGGAGLGLALVRTIVQSHGGSVAISDSPLGGARLEVRLPRPGADGTP